MITVTGATGLIGSHLLKQLTAYHTVVRALRRTGARPRISLEREPHWIDGSLSDLGENDFTGTDCLIHLAAHGVDQATATWDDCFRCNVMESIALWRHAAKAGVKNFVICGSCFEYGETGDSSEYISVDSVLRPTGPYGASKAAATMAACALASSQDVKVWVLRPFHIYGEGESAPKLFPQIIASARQGGNLALTEGRQIRDFLHVADAAKLIHGYALLLEKEERTSFFKISNVGTGNPVALRDFALKVWEANGGKGRLQFGAIPYRNAEVMRYVPEIDKAEQGAATDAVARLAKVEPVPP